MALTDKPSGVLVEYLDEGRLNAALVIREFDRQAVVVDASGREHKISRDLVLVRHRDRTVARENLRDALAELALQHEALSRDLDLNLLWEIARERERGLSARELAGIFFGRDTPLETAVMLAALLDDRLYFVRRHLEFVPRDPEQVERLRVQYEKIRLRSEGGKRNRAILSAILAGGPLPEREATDQLIAPLTRYLENPFARDRDVAALLESIAGEITPAEAAYEILVRLGARPAAPRSVLIGSLRTGFSPAALKEADEISSPSHPAAAGQWTVTIDDDETVEIDDAIAAEELADGRVRVKVHIALVSDFVPRGGPLDLEAAERGSTIYLPEASLRMLPDRISTEAVSLIAGAGRNVLTTEVLLDAAGEIRTYSIYPQRLSVNARLSYARADRLLSTADGDDPFSARLLRTLARITDQLRNRRRAAGARLFQRREPKVTVSGDEIAISVIEPSPSRELVAELMVLSNYLAARWAVEHNLPMVFRGQPQFTDDLFAPRAKLSLEPQFHAGIGLQYYVQASSPIRRYLDLVLQRQLVASLDKAGAPPLYRSEELLDLIAAAEATETSLRELERRAKRYWILTHLRRQPEDQTFSGVIANDGATVELCAYAIRGILHGAPNLPAGARVIVALGRIDPVRGLLNLNYRRTQTAAEKGAD